MTEKIKIMDLNDHLMAGTLDEHLARPRATLARFPVHETVASGLSAAFQKALQPREFKRLTCGHCQLDSMSGGLRRGECWLVGADTSWGKSSFAIMVADENLKRGKRACIVTAEDDPMLYHQRLLARRSGVPASDIRNGRVSSYYDRLTSVVSTAEHEVYIINGIGFSIEQLSPIIKESVRQYAIDLIIFDYIGAFVSKSEQSERRNTVSSIGRVITDIVKTCVPGGAAGIILSQLTHSDLDKVPGKYAIRDSKDLVHMAETVLVGHIAQSDRAGLVSVGDRVLTLHKAKSGIPGKSVVMPWNPTTASFEVTHDPEEQRLEELTQGFQEI